MDEETPRLTRRRSPEAQYETWEIWYDNVRVGTIAVTAGLNGATGWTWTCGFHTSEPHRFSRWQLIGTDCAVMNPFSSRFQETFVRLSKTQKQLQIGERL